MCLGLKSKLLSLISDLSSHRGKLGGDELSRWESTDAWSEDLEAGKWRIRDLDWHDWQKNHMFLLTHHPPAAADKCSQQKEKKKKQERKHVSSEYQRMQNTLRNNNNCKHNQLWVISADYSCLADEPEGKLFVPKTWQESPWSLKQSRTDTLSSFNLNPINLLLAGWGT